MREPLYRSRTDRILVGVAGGVADWLDVDPSVVRLVWALLVLAGGAGILLYIVAAIVIPEEPPELAPTQAPPTSPGSPPSSPRAASDPAAPAAAVGPAMVGALPSRREASQARRAARQATRGERDGSGFAVLGVLLVLVGGLLLVRNLLPDLDLRLVGPAFLVVIGLVLVLGALGRRPSPPRP
jgi:phage shock protein C